MLLFEFLVLFAGGPILILWFKSRLLMIAVLWLSALGVYLFMRRYSYRHAADWNWQGLRSQWRPVAARFAVIAALIALAVWVFKPDMLFSLPSQRPGLWLAIMLVYPLLSVWPQEIVYRAFIHHRYAPLFGRDRGYVAASALAFSFMHMIFLNWPAVLLTLCGGALMAQTYRANRSLALACFEHALYGCFIFTIGLGLYFYSGAAWRQ